MSSATIFPVFSFIFSTAAVIVISVTRVIKLIICLTIHSPIITIINIIFIITIIAVNVVIVIVLIITSLRIIFKNF